MKAKYWPGRLAIVAVLIGSLYGTGLSSAPIQKPSIQKRVDVIRIDSMSAFGDLEKPPVEFLHDKHTEALSKKQLDCTACHLTRDDRIYPEFNRTNGADRIGVMNGYHDGCIACHGKMKVMKEQTGPIACDDCHAKKNRYASSRQPMGMDKSLHFRHIKASEDQCQRCHHEYGETEKKLVYVEGKEGTCRYCHLQETTANRIAMRLASHIACINCHIKIKPQETVKPPVTCAGCHDAAVQEKIKKVAKIPRLKRKQPDTVLLESFSKDDIPDKGMSRMSLVPFNHKAHEIYSDTCRGCHHANLNSCKACHTLNGSSEGKGVTIEKAAHKTGSQRSCLGCHEQRKQAQNCAGCHQIAGRQSKIPDASCLKCHAVPISEFKASPAPNDEAASMQPILEPTSIPSADTYTANEIPERVLIKWLSSQYEPVDFPHLKVVNAIVENIKGDKLAAYFHGQKDTICQGCHHNSPLSRRPPNCGNCHASQWDRDNPTKPGVLGAYHQQCIGCHKAMNIERPMGCTECHKDKFPLH